MKVRSYDKQVEITYKRKIPSKLAKIRQETEIIVNDYATAKKLELALGYRETSRITKRRVSYILGNVRFEFDKLLSNHKFVLEFMEIEVTTVKDVYKYVKLLGFTKSDCLTWSGNDVIKYYQNKK